MSRDGGGNLRSQCQEAQELAGQIQGYQVTPSSEIPRELPGETGPVLSGPAAGSELTGPGEATGASQPPPPSGPLPPSPPLRKHTSPSLCPVSFVPHPPPPFSSLSQFKKGWCSLCASCQCLVFKRPQAGLPQGFLLTFLLPL